MKLINYVYRSTVQQRRPLRRLFRDRYVFTVSESRVDTIHQDRHPHAFLKDLVREIYNVQRDDQGERVHKVSAAEEVADPGAVAARFAGVRSTPRFLAETRGARLVVV